MIISGDFNNPLSTIDRTRQQISKDTENQSQLPGSALNRSAHLTTVQYIFSSSVCGTYTKTSDILGQETNPRNLEEPKSYRVCSSTIKSNYNSIVETLTRKSPNIWNKQHASKSPTCQKKSRGGQAKEEENTTYQNVWNTTSELKGKCIAPGACSRKKGKFQINNLSALLKNLEK